MEWCTWQNKKIDDIVSYINNYINKDKNYEYQIYVGCDSQKNKKQIVTYATVIVIHKVGKGAHIVFSREREQQKHKNIFVRLWGEVERSMKAMEILKNENIKVKKLTIDFDLNELPKYKSHVVTNSAIGFAKGEGHQVRIKPEAFSATYAANKCCRK